MIGRLAMGAMTAMSMGCAAVPADSEKDRPEEEAADGGCDAAGAQSLVGRTATSELGTDAMRMTGARSLRWIPEGAMVTMDYRPDRLNIELDGRNKVTRIRCG